MGNAVLGFPNQVDGAVLSGGSWVASLPLQFLQDKVYAMVARTTDTRLSSTMVNIDFGRSMKLNAWAIRNHNFTLDARIRVRGSANADMTDTDYDSGWKDVWPMVYADGDLEWEDDNWWDGKYTEDELKGAVIGWYHLMPEVCLSRYWRIEINDQDNPAGYLQMARLLAFPTWQFKTNLSYGSSLTFETKTGVQEARSGTEYFDERATTRVARFTLDLMKQDEALTRAYELMRQAGISNEVLFIYDPEDTVHALRRQMIARLRTLSALEHPAFDNYKTGFEIKDWV